MATTAFLAFDLGAESGRTILGHLQEGRLAIKSLNRFPNRMVQVLGHLHWDIFQLFEEMKNGIRACVQEERIQPEGLAVDTWGVDFGLLASDGTVLSLPYTYRDSRTEGAMEALFKKIPRERIYQLTGIQFLPFNSLFQLYALARDQSPLLALATDLLFMPDLFNYFMTGRKMTEFTSATTSQLFNPAKLDWEGELLEALGISRSILQKVVRPGTLLGRLDKSICTETGIAETPVIAVASHDTGSAVAAVPAEEDDWAYISSGTWSLMGVETKSPVMAEKALELNFTNEGGVAGTFRFLKNITGLWLLQECRRSWARTREYSYEELLKEASSAKPFQALVDPDWLGFLNPASMPEAISDYCLRSGQPAPQTPAAFVRCILESLALKYRQVLEELHQVLPQPIGRIHVIGGGAQNRLLCQFTADAAGLPVIAGPVEAAAIGNILIQALCLGYLDSQEKMREIVRMSFEPVRYEPRLSRGWDEAYFIFQEIISKEK